MKSIAIIGAGPAGLVAAKTLLHSYPIGTFAVTIFEQGTSVGGLWAVEANPNYGLINPDMSTNLSQFTVCFSDLAWETLELQPAANIFPKAWQVNRYLEYYARKFIPAGVISFQTQVKNAEQIHADGRSKWEITFINLRDQSEKNQMFDCLIIATGLFSGPGPVPFELDGTDFSLSSAHILHSSGFRRLGDLSSTGQQPSQGKILIVGGSHSGAEVAAAIAMQMSDARYSPSGSGIEPLEIIHAVPYPLFALPPFVQSDKGLSPTFMPLDVLLNDLSSRLDDPISFGYGHTNPEKQGQLEGLLETLMNGARDEKDSGGSEKEKPTQFNTPYAVISESYVEFVRSGAITPILGRVVRLSNQKEEITQKGTELICATIIEDSVEIKIKDIVAVVNATGFSSPALDFISSNLKDSIGLDANYPHLPLLLNRDASTSSGTAPRSLALIGFSYGSYWGVLETQARIVAKKWALDDESSLSLPSDLDEKSEKLYSFMKELRSTMKDNPSSVPQNFLGDYPGLMEEASRELGLQRVDLNWGPKEGMVNPARYIDSRVDSAEARKTMKKLQKMTDASANYREFSARATFRALQGNWNVKSKGSLGSTTNALPMTATFNPRCPTDITFDLEYLFVLRAEEPNRPSDCDTHANELERSVYRLRETANEIEVWNVNPREDLTVDKLRYTLKFSKATSDDKKRCLTLEVELSTDPKYMATVHSFQFSGVHVTKFTIGDRSNDPSLGDTSIFEFSR
ncbi:hypothetical protein B7494_g4370 [Chlorociboria aeruginascens]|nr:hypothetical protein B7494_g4370 [Chlorociboria aeruginascens]